MKRILRRTAFLLAVLLVLLPTAGCASQKGEGGLIRLTDASGFSFTLEKPAERIVSGYYVTTYALLALGLEEKIVGVEQKAETRPLYALASPELASLPAVGSMKECNPELIASLEPDLVLLPKKLSDAAETLRSLGIPVLTVSPESQEELEEMLISLGSACGAEERAEALLSFYRDGLTGLAERNEGTERPTVVFCGNSSYLTAAPEGMYQSSLIEWAGGKNGAASSGSGSYWTEISYETWLTWDPDWVILPSDAAYSVEDFCADGMLASLSAVKNGRVRAMPSELGEWDSPVPTGILGALWLSSLLHPESYSPDELPVTEFYETFYGFTPDPALWE